MKFWISDLNKQERRTMSACFGGWALDAFDVQIYSFVIPTLVAVWGMTRAEAGYLGTVALVFSAVGGAVAGRLSDRIGRVQVLKLTVAWFAFFTFLSGFAQNFEQLLVLRALQGLGFGGEWAAGAVLMSEIIRPKYRGRAAGTVHSGFAVGWGGAALVYALVFSLVPQEYAWRCLFWLGILPAFLIVVIRRYVKESETFEEKAKQTSTHKISALGIFKPPLLRKTLASSLFAIGMQGGYYAVVTWLPTYLKTERNLSVLGTGSYLAVVIVGAFLGFLLGAHCADALGRKKTLMTFGILSAAMVCLYMFAPLSNSAMLILGFPLGLFANAMFAPTGAFYAELFPTELRGTGQGFAYNLGRGVGAFFPALVGLLSATMPLGMAIGIYTVSAYGIAIVALLFLPETQGVALDQESSPGERLSGDEQPGNTPA
ncbi:MFS transporter [Alloalcanivorax sp. C16-1]|uniref:MFS transporter n=1 Tax=Alloalcanivorax sp. C16-1 TaxID=3390051 RepID=UPI003970FC91